MQIFNQSKLSLGWFFDWKNQPKKLKKVRKIIMMLCTYFAGRANTTICEFVADTVEELMNDAPTTTKKGTGNFSHFTQCVPIGSTCTVGNGGSTKVFMLFSDGWQEV